MASASLEATGRGRTAAAAHQEALGRVYQVYQDQASTMAYSDVFLIAGLISFAVAPLCILLSPRKGGGGGAGAH